MVNIMYEYVASCRMLQNVRLTVGAGRVVLSGARGTVEPGSVRRSGRIAGPKAAGPSRVPQPGSQPPEFSTLLPSCSPRFLPPLLQPLNFLSPCILPPGLASHGLLPQNAPFPYIFIYPNLTHSSKLV